MVFGSVATIKQAQQLQPETVYFFATSDATNTTYFSYLKKRPIIFCSCEAV
jgi:hypothetical protein